MRVGLAVIACAAATLLPGCGGSADQAGEEPARPGTLRALWDAPGENVGLVMGTSDYAPGDVRVVFLVVDSQSRAIFSAGGARVWLSRGLDEAPFAEGKATLETVGVPGASTTSEADVSRIYVATLEVPEPGTYWLLAEPLGAKPAVQGVGNVVVADRSKTPPVGARAYPSRTPTVRSAKGDLSALTTRTPPDRELLEHSIAESLKAGKPFVVAFATPKFCESRTCGPVVDIVDAVRRRVGSKDVRFIHVEIYEGNDPALGTNRWVQEWRLPTEPWVFLVGADGRIKAKFEGAVSVEELTAAVREHLSP